MHANPELDIGIGIVEARIDEVEEKGQHVQDEAQDEVRRVVLCTMSVYTMEET